MFVRKNTNLSEVNSKACIVLELGEGSAVITDTSPLF